MLKEPLYYPLINKSTDYFIVIDGDSRYLGELDYCYRDRIIAEIIKMSTSNVNFMEDERIIADIKKYLGDDKQALIEINREKSNFHSINMQVRFQGQESMSNIKWFFYTAEGYYYRFRYIDNKFDELRRININDTAYIDWEYFDYPPSDWGGCGKEWYFYCPI